MNESPLSFLRHACGAIQNYDRDGRALVPLGAWPLILEDLELDASEDRAAFIKEHLEVADDKHAGFFSYMPILEAIGGPPPGAADVPAGDRSPPQPTYQSPRDPEEEALPQREPARLVSGGHTAEVLQVEESPARRPASGGQMAEVLQRRAPEESAVQRPSSQASDAVASRGQMAGGQMADVMRRRDEPSAPRPASKGSGGGQMADIFGGPPASRPASTASGGQSAGGQMAAILRPRPQPIAEEPQLYKDSARSQSTTIQDTGEDYETFWAKRASTIQRLYNLWDCNQLTNEAFVFELQKILGSRVDMGEDSEFVKLTNQHRFARNLKFAQLMSALRHDARNTKIAGVPGSPSGSVGFGGGYGSVYGSLGGGYGGGSNYEPSEAPSDYYAAGRPTKAGFSAGRKHYTPSESDFGDDSASNAARSRREPPPRARAPYSVFSDLPTQQQQPDGNGSNVRQMKVPPLFAQREMPSEPAAPRRNPISGDGGYGSSPAPAAPAPRSPPPFAMGGNFEQGYRKPAQPPSPSSRPGTGQGPDFWSRKDADCRSDVGSVADSQLEFLTERDRSGHGNILTWGNDSRQITPHRKRQGRQLAEGADGQPKAYGASNVFPASP